MKKFSSLKLNTKLTLSILFVILLIYITIFAYMAATMPTFVRSGVENLANNNAARYSNLFKAYISEDMRASRMIADVFETYTPLTAEEKMKRSLAILQREYKKHPYYRAVYTSWERKYVDPTWNKDYGRIRISLTSPPKSDDDYSNVEYDTLDIFSDNIKGAYYNIKLNRKDFFSNPYQDTYQGKLQTVATVASAVVYKGKFMGSTGIDIPLSRFADIISKVKSFYGSNIFLISNNGTFVGNKKKELIGKSIYDVTGSNAEYVLANVNKGKPFSFYNIVKGEKYYVTMNPLNITGSDTPWMIGVTVPDEAIIDVMIYNFRPLLLVVSIGLILVIITLYYMSSGITKPIIHISKILRLIAKGEIGEVEKMDFRNRDEIGEIVDSTNILVENLKETAEFAQQIGAGNINTEYNIISEKDLLGNSLIEMRESLKKAKNEEDKRREYEERQNWATIGFAKFGELLRNNTDNMEEFTYNVISNLVKYTKSNQGAMFLLNDDTNNPYLTMSSCYAYDRKKFVDKKIDLGSNLVGQCFLEAQTIYMTDVPNNYVSITSGLGDANPKAIIIVPLKFNDKVFGVIEMASFSKYEDYKIEFIEKLAENIASTISTVKVNMQTVSLLQESKLKSEELASQEEEMRQNLEELQSTQEESARKEIDINGILNALNSTYFVIELDIDANIININENAKQLLAINRNNDIEDKNLREFLSHDELEEFETEWREVINGKSISKQHEIIRNNNKLIISESYTPVYNTTDDIVKILNIGVEIKK